MDEKQKKALKKKLQQEIKNTEKKINTYNKLCKPIAPENAIGRVSRMDAINNKSVVEAALRTAKEKMAKLHAIENKISDARFGICKNCNQEIPFGRLIIRPYSEFCVTCAK